MILGVLKELLTYQIFCYLELYCNIAKAEARFCNKNIVKNRQNNLFDYSLSGSKKVCCLNPKTLKNQNE